MTEPESAVLKPLHYRERVCQRRRQPTRLLYTSSCDATTEGQMAVWVFRCPYRLLSPLAAESEVNHSQHVRGYRATRSGTHGLPPARRDADWVLPLSGRIFGTQSARPVWDIARFPARTRLLVGCSARRRKLNWLRGMGGEKRTVESARKNAFGGYWSESRPVSQSSEQPIKSARITASWRVNGRSPVSFA